ncbi:hypothetical protein M0811_11609 [Anaeramoeba ignava]|uniref:Uncharacterized protein n=1 Tax=Anaeramoeba ignava TaxID=1746090 RepID=A0A9Q0LAS3_ANAIG|nr:hypothetical protein M0811_11609 [Anaeramoeba ignava]
MNEKLGYYFFSRNSFEKKYGKNFDEDYFCFFKNQITISQLQKRTPISLHSHFALKCITHTNSLKYSIIKNN